MGNDVAWRYSRVICLYHSFLWSARIQKVWKALFSSALKMTLGLTELLDLAISPQIGPVNFFHLRNLLHTIVEHFGIGEIKAQQAEIQGARSLGSSSSQTTTSSDEDSQSENEEGWFSLYVQF